LFQYFDGFVNYKKGCTRLAATSDKGYQFLAHGRWFSPGTPASSTTKTGRNDIAEILLKVALNTKNQINIKQQSVSLIFNNSVVHYMDLKLGSLSYWPHTDVIDDMPKHYRDEFLTYLAIIDCTEIRK